jgi:RimJ/RimL family protein N-acetyltransferase
MIVEFWGVSQQARAQRRCAGSSAARRPTLQRLAGWLRPGRSRQPGRQAGPGASGQRVMLRDGSAVLIRQVQPSDAPLLADGFARLSAHSRQMRFLRRKDELSAAELRYFTDVDHHDHEALGALDPGGRGVGIARYVRHANDPHAAEIALTIVDDWQGRGLGTELLAQLTDRARSAGIRRFTALVATSNAAMTALLDNVGGTPVGRGPGTVEYEITLGPRQEPSLVWWFRSLDDIVFAWR